MVANDMGGFSAMQPLRNRFAVTQMKLRVRIATYHRVATFAQNRLQSPDTSRATGRLGHFYDHGLSF
jgi:hypothetical protein